MSLEEYNKKRNFEKSLEPKGEVKKIQERKGKIFVIQKHHARKLHWDLRLEINGVLKSWAIPKEPPMKEGIKRLAVQTEDHPIEYANFEGEIPEGMYGAGKVKIWDKGKFIPEKIEEGEILFELKGEKLKGNFALIKLKSSEKFKGKNNWLFFKRKSYVEKEE
ncbi:MAG: 3'-phosphoesterase [Deltaproteobacteria bacterium]|nr:MAG: 3'-phosphoesterase [Deltaproteobacteria bacterium]